LFANATATETATATATATATLALEYPRGSPLHTHLSKFTWLIINMRVLSGL